MRRKIYSINRLNPPSSVKTLIYQVYLLPILDYCDIVWTPTKQTKCLERLHSKYTSCSDSFISRYSLTERQKFHTIVQVYKTLHRTVPEYLHNLFEHAISVTGRTNRNDHRMFVPQVNTNYGKHSSTALYDSTTLTQFKYFSCVSLIRSNYCMCMCVCVCCAQGVA